LVSQVMTWIGVPRFWMTLGAVLIIAAMGLTYHNDQNLADKTLATKVNLPDPVRIQDFDRASNSNLLGELQVLAEADIDQSVLHQFGEGDLQESYLLLPVYPVSEGSFVRAASFINEQSRRPHRPVSRASAANKDTPIAVLVYDMTDKILRPRDAEAFGLTVLGRGFNGDLALVSGVAFSRAFLAEGTTRQEVEIAARVEYNLSGSQAVPLIAPFIALRATPRRADMTEARNLLGSVGTIALLFGLSLLARGFSKHPIVLKSSGLRKPNQTGTGQSALFFDPLLPQDEIQKAENDARVSSEMSFERISRHVGPVLSRLKSRR